MNRLKPILPSIIWPNQVSFLSNRRVADIAIIVQEYINHFRNIKAKMPMVLKIDLKKAFDMLEWSFIRDSLLAFNFPITTINLLISCVSSSDISVLVNGRKTSFFKPTKEIMQGSLSTYSSSTWKGFLEVLSLK